MRTIRVEGPTEAFKETLGAIWEDGEWVGQKKELLNVVTEISNPDKTVYWEIIDSLDDFHGEDHFEITSDWTFPENPNSGLTGSVRATSGDGKYFQRLCHSDKGNQIDSMINKIEQWGRNNRTVAQVFKVDVDLNAMFPPCLMQVQVFYRDGEINLTAYFRSHTLAKSYLGDIVGLSRLQKYITESVNIVPIDIGSLVVHSGSLHIRKKNDEHKLAEEMYERYH